MPIYDREMRERLPAERLYEVKQQVMKEKELCDYVNFWIVANKQTGQILEAHSRPVIVTEEDILKELDCREECHGVCGGTCEGNCGENCDYVIYKVDCDDFCVIREELCCYDNTLDRRFNERTIEGVRLRGKPKHQDKIQRLNYQKPPAQISRLRNPIAEPESLTIGIPTLIATQRVTAVRSNKIRVRYRGDFLKAYTGRRILI